MIWELVFKYIYISTDDLNLAYHSILPLEVHGANYCSMRLLTKQYSAPQMVGSDFSTVKSIDQTIKSKHNTI